MMQTCMHTWQLLHDIYIGCELSTINIQGLGVCDDVGNPSVNIQRAATHANRVKLAVSDLASVQVRVVALGCAADLFKTPEAQNYLATHQDFLRVLVECMKVCHALRN